MMGITTSILNDVPYKDLQLIAHIIYHEGPYLSHFQDTDGNNILFQWCDVTDIHNRWLVLAVTEDQMGGFLQKEISQRELLLNAKGDIVYIVDINDRGEHERVISIPSEEIPEEYLSSPDSFFDESLSPYIGDGYAFLLANVQKLRQRIDDLEQFEPAFYMAVEDMVPQYSPNMYDKDSDLSMSLISKIFPKTQKVGSRNVQH